MTANSEFNKRRLENIKRNNELLKKLNLAGIPARIRSEAGIEDHRKASGGAVKKKQGKAPVKREAKPAPIPTRRSRRLRGEAADVEGEAGAGSDTAQNVKQEEEWKELKEARVVGDIKLSDLIKSEDDGELLEKFRRYADKSFSGGDFFEELQRHQKPNPEVQRLREEMRLQQYDVFDPKELAIVHERVTALCFHPSQEKKLIVGGDTAGTVGLWNVADENPDPEHPDSVPDITRFKLFSRNVSKIEVFPTDSSKILAASYDGALRSIDMQSLKSDELLHFQNEHGDTLGISDCQFSYDSPNVVMLTTLGGEFAQRDLRTKPDTMNIMRLSDKKIGCMAIDPSRPYSVATASLDRTLRIWDLRKTVAKPDWSQYEDYASHEVVSTYNSRLSVSAVSYAPIDHTLVCNGYDNTVRLFNARADLPSELQPDFTIQHNCKSGRWVSVLKARFKLNMDVFAIANMKRAIDIYTSRGEQLSHLETSTVPAVVSWHPMQNWIVGGNNSGKVFLFTDAPQE
ncbi:ACR194Cp [Eremothecium gossypii ATCC 10895]|uniref:DNA damage-binding protein CMR1 n=1 Tax=Eremothecium gossypii (strain ATCC 10895 / CBS 109.51 / FGSC 9923 / NRRL Y-1056) TaxID=284811 RepID=CMR1_EREGS|nr:ACR194Cp [Eremothecium gossypii ATCC 10895]Q75BS7.1 RecName: Full=DNA damage-binding protein CMR1 [Eremothecium gossypii ATCC 10895]AAS51420.1 ACR194Cp [Eremothecium gossypii ATCC 10895]AEY95711.1 FACR194Cp [Eremothecium gossypii FDAG1]